MKNNCKIVTWNINGLKKLVQQGIPNAPAMSKPITLNTVLLWLEADIIAFQEIKVGTVVISSSFLVVFLFH